MHVIVWLPGLSYALFARRIELGPTHCKQIRAAVELLGHCLKQIR
ncbi:MAG: hypothetical protein WCB10_08730 [Steroidobacteraceae bacterium]